MATAGKNLSTHNPQEIPSGKGFKIALVVSEWNNEITYSLLSAAKQILIEHEVAADDLLIHYVPGSYELPLATQWVLSHADGAIAIGSIIQGETRHFEFVCQAVAQGIKDVSLKMNKPAVFCVLTDNTLQQAKDRSGGKHGNKGVECAIALLKMLNLKKNILLQ
jgi:6,7-dimethyl-8-ribityllumazine synthase